MKVAWFLWACVALAAGIAGGRAWLTRPEYRVEAVTGEKYMMFRKWEVRSGRVWVYVVGTNNVAGWMEMVDR